MNQKEPDFELHVDWVGHLARFSTNHRNLIFEKYRRTHDYSYDQNDLIELDTNIRVKEQQGSQISQLVGSINARETLEIGLGYGFSTAWIMAALDANGGGSHTSVDPFQMQLFHGIGIRCGEMMQDHSTFTWANELSIHFLSDAVREERSFDFIFIDGNHRFDDVLVDFYLADMLLSPGGVIALDDLWMPSIQAVCSFIRKNRSYVPIEQPAKNMLALKKVGHDERDWRHFVEFNAKTANTLPYMKRLKRLVRRGYRKAFG